MSADAASVLARRVRRDLDRPVHAAVSQWGARLGTEAGAIAVLFYGSNLRTGSLDGVLDFYLLLPGPQKERIWPRIGYHETPVDGHTLRAKTATMSLVRFAQAARGHTRETTIWARFTQPAALVWTRDADAAEAIANAVGDAVRTASMLAAAVGPDCGRESDFWRALFRATYRAEFRVEATGREDSILELNRAHFDGLLTDAWNAQGLAFDSAGGLLCPHLAPTRRRAIRRWWELRRRLGKAVNLTRLAKAARTFDGAADYAAWKIERHTGIALPLTPFRRKHPLLAAPGVLWTLWRARRGGRA